MRYAHSVSKFLSGHGDVLAGSVGCRLEDYDRLTNMLIQVGSALGAALAGWLFEWTGSYTSAFISAAVMAFIAAALALAIREAPIVARPMAPARATA